MATFELYHRGIIDGLLTVGQLSVAGGTVGDMFTKEQLSAPMMIYTASPCK